MPASKPNKAGLFGAAPLLFLAHFLLELALGAVKMRGTYSGTTMPEGTERFVRHHGVSLLAIALLGGLVWWRRLANTLLTEQEHTQLTLAKSSRKAQSWQPTGGRLAAE